MFNIPALDVRPGEMNQFRLVLSEGGPVAIDAIAVGERLKLDDTNEAGQTDAKIADWVETLKSDI